MRKVFLLISIVFFIGIHSQTGSNPNPVNYSIDMYPKTPEAAALSKFVDIPAGNYTGVADFTIPLYTIDFNGNKIPIELRYTTTGVTVGQIATNVGLGWVLNTGASLSQQVIGVQDTSFPRKVLQSPSLFPDPRTNYPGSDYDIAMSASGIKRDGLNPRDIKPDIFTYSLSNNSGKFILNADGDKGIPMPYNQIRIARDWRNGQIEITDDKGFKYFFSNDNNVLKTKNTCTENNADPQFNFFDPSFNINKIISPQNSEIKYIYSSNNVKYVNSVMTQARISLYKPIPQPPGPQPYHGFKTKCANYTVSADPAVKEIHFDGGKVLFSYSAPAVNPRLDMNGGVFLTNIAIKNDSGEIIRSFTLNYDYFVSPEPIPAATGIFTNKGDYLTGLNRRLKLTSVVDNLTLGVYSFEYFESYEGKTLPYRISNNQDYWGIYNGANNGEKAISLSKYEDDVNLNGPDSEGIHLIGANKNPDINYGRLGNLKKITYPTGGYTEIEYEADDFDISENPEIVYDTTEKDDPNEAKDDSALPTLFTLTNNSSNKELELIGRTGTTTNGSCTWHLKMPDGVIKTGVIGVGIVPRPNDPPGEYELWVNPDEMYPYQRCKVIYKFTEIIKTPIDTISTKKIGTIRVSEIKSIDNRGGIITRKYTYQQPTANHVLPYTKSSGVNQGEELFMSLSLQKYPVGDQGGTVTEQIASNNPGWQTTTVKGKAVGYDYVQEYYVDHVTPSNSYRKEYKFINVPEPQYHDPNTAVNVTWINTGLDRGLLQEEQLFDSQGKIVKKIVNEYQYDGYFNNNYAVGSPYGQYHMGYGLEVIPISKFGATGTGYSYTFDLTTFALNNYWLTEKKTTSTDFANHGSDSLKIEKTIFYSPTYNHTFPKEINTLGSKGETLKTVKKYPQDFVAGEQDYSMMGNLISRNQIADPVVTTSYTDNKATSEVRTVYGQFSSGPGSNPMFLPKSIYLKKGEDAQEVDRKITYKSYDTKGNLTQYNLEDGIPVSIIWAYNKTLPVAKIEGAQFDDVKENSLVAAVITAAENDNVGVQGQTPDQTEQELNNALDALRRDTFFKTYQITTYTYDPLVGVKSVTPPSGIREYYFYDDAGRLQSVKIKEKDANGQEVYRILKEYEYHYKQ